MASSFSLNFCRNGPADMTFVSVQELDPQPEKGPEDAAFENAGKEAEEAAPVEEEAAPADSDGEADKELEEAEDDMETDIPVEEPVVPDMQDSNPGTLLTPKLVAEQASFAAEHGNYRCDTDCGHEETQRTFLTQNF